MFEVFNLGRLHGRRRSTAPGVRIFKGGTLPATNIVPENRDSPNGNFIFQPSIFRCYINLRILREGGYPPKNLMSPFLVQQIYP